MTIAYPHGDLIPCLTQSNLTESNLILWSLIQNYTEGTNDPGPGCTDGESDEEETELKRDEEVGYILTK